jgi:hypothetical protein
MERALFRAFFAGPSAGTKHSEPKHSLPAQAGIITPDHATTAGVCATSEKVETAGVEPASAVACKAASTSVAGALVSSPARLAGGVAGGQPAEDVPGLARADRTG